MFQTNLNMGGNTAHIYITLGRSRLSAYVSNSVHFISNTGRL